MKKKLKTKKKKKQNEKNPKEHIKQQQLFEKLKHTGNLGKIQIINRGVYTQFYSTALERFFHHSTDSFEWQSPGFIVGIDTL